MLTVTDLFCGAGGSSSGAIQVPGVQIRMAANHWKLAVETHNTNHPTADHDCADISQADPRRYPATDILWASPECTNHSQAKGQRRKNRQPDLFDEVLPDEAAERSRATMFDVLRFAEIHRYRGIVVENVVDVRDWVLWPAWAVGLDNLGYDHEIVYLNSMFAQGAGAPAPQSRDRLYVVAWRRGNRRPNLRRWTSPQAWCPACDRMVRGVQAWKRPDRPHGRYRQQYVYRCPTPRCYAEVYPGVLPAAVAIDWALPAERIGDRARPLAEKTVARIEAGLRRYAQPPFLTPMRSGRPRTLGLDEPLATVVANGSNHGLVDRTMVVPLRTNGTTTPASEPFKTFVAGNVGQAIAGAPMLVPAGGTWNDSAQPVEEPFRTRTTRDNDALVVPVEGRAGLAARPAGEPARTQTARLQDALVVPLRNNGVARPAGTDPAPTVAAAGNHHALVVRNNTGGAEMSTPVDEPLRTLTATGHQSLVSWDAAMVMRNMTARGDQGQMSYPPTEPLRTVLAEQRQSLIRWDHLLVPYGRTGLVREVDHPMPAQTTIQGDALVGPSVAVDDCTFRMLEPHEIQLAMAFDAAYEVLGNKRERVRQLGNAVTPPAARDLIAALVEAITGEQLDLAGAA